MMDYLKDYISGDEIEKLDKILEDSDYFKYEVDKVTKVLDIFKGIGVTNFYELIKVGHEMFYDTIESIEKRIENYGNNEELATLINEDAHNLVLADLI